MLISGVLKPGDATTALLVATIKPVNQQAFKRHCLFVFYILAQILLFYISSLNFFTINSRIFT